MNENDFERVMAHPVEQAPFSWEEAWDGAAGGAWRFWNRIAAARRSTAPRRDEEMVA